MTFCTDVDLLHWEPNIFRDASVAAQLLLSAKAKLEGTTLTCSSIEQHADLADHVVVLSGGISGSFPIVAVCQPKQLTISVLYDGLFVGKEVPPDAIGVASDLDFSIRTFQNQRECVGNLICEAAGVNPATAATVIMNQQALRRPASLGTLQMICNQLAAASSQPEPLKMRADLYERLYRRALCRCRLELDMDGDGKPDKVKTLDVLELARI